MKAWMRAKHFFHLNNLTFFAILTKYPVYNFKFYKTFLEIKVKFDNTSPALFFYKYVPDLTPQLNRAPSDLLLLSKPS